MKVAAVALAVVTACKKKEGGGGLVTIDLRDGDAHSYIVVRDLDHSQRGVSAVRVSHDVFKFSLGLTSPVHLLSYRHRDASPAFCRREAILDRIKQLAENAGCVERKIDLGAAPTRLISCDLPQDPTAGASTCPAEYVAQIWQERWQSSTEDYELEMYARIRVGCARREFETYRASDAQTAAAEKRSDSVMELLKACRATEADPGSGNN